MFGGLFSLDARIVYLHVCFFILKCTLGSKYDIKWLCIRYVIIAGL